MTDLTGERVLVTGGGVRLGRAICAVFAAAGARVVIHYHRSGREAAELLDELGGGAAGHSAVQADLTVAEQRAQLIPSVVTNGRLDILVNNASVYRRSPLANVDAQHLRSDYEINFVAPFILMTDFARLCGRGCIVNLLDQRVGRVDPAAGAYGLAKKSLRDATEAAAVEWAPAIRVNGVAPGIVLPPPGVSAEKMQPLLANVPMGVQSSVEEVAAACVFLAQAETITGQTLYVDGGLHLADWGWPEAVGTGNAKDTHPSGGAGKRR